MYYRFTKLGRNVIYFNAVVSVVVGIVHLYNAYRIKVSNDIILAYMAENSVTRGTAIRRLISLGEDLFVGGEFATYFGIVAVVLTLIILYNFARNSGFILGVFASLSALLTNFIGGLALFFVIFTGRIERNTVLPTDDVTGDFQQTDWQNYINQRAVSKKSD